MHAKLIDPWNKFMDDKFTILCVFGWNNFPIVIQFDGHGISLLILSMISAGYIPVVFAVFWKARKRDSGQTRGRFKLGMGIKNSNIGFKIMNLGCVIGHRGMTIQLPSSNLATLIILKPIDGSVARPIFIRII
jgi:hypothetical protein